MEIFELVVIEILKENIFLIVFSFLICREDFNIILGLKEVRKDLRR